MDCLTVKDLENKFALQQIFSIITTRIIRPPFGSFISQLVEIGQEGRPLKYYLIITPFLQLRTEISVYTLGYIQDLLQLFRVLCN